jgi:hypothetical protein
VRELMAQLGIRKFDDLIGRADLLDMKKGIEHWKAKGLDYSRIFCRRAAEVPRLPPKQQDHGLAKALDNSSSRWPSRRSSAARRWHRSAGAQRQPHRRAPCCRAEVAEALRPRRPAGRHHPHRSTAPPARASAPSWRAA